MNTLLKALRMVRWQALSATRAFCPRCDAARFFIRLNTSEIGIRCWSCRASLVSLSLIDVLREVLGDLSSKSVYELSSRGVLFEYLKENAGSLTCSEFLDDAAPGSCHQGVLCQDVQKLTFEAASFDLCTSLEVFEHVPRDHDGFSEICRVLKDDGHFIFTVPLDLNANTLERARLGPGGQIEHLTTPEYHTDPLRDDAPILAFRTYGLDIVDRLLAAGFERAEIRSSRNLNLWDGGRAVVVAYKRWKPDDASKVDPLVIRFAQRE